MSKTSPLRFQLRPCVRWLVSIALFSHTAFCIANAEETFVFAGKCSNGEPYRLVSYQRSVDGVSLSYYDYQGPAGIDTVQSDAAPKVMAVRVCRKLAEIINAQYWE
jgi:hypothetical protein